MSQVRSTIYIFNCYSYTVFYIVNIIKQDLYYGVVILNKVFDRKHEMFWPFAVVTNLKRNLVLYAIYVEYKIRWLFVSRGRDAGGATTLGACTTATYTLDAALACIYDKCVIQSFIWDVCTSQINRRSVPYVIATFVIISHLTTGKYYLCIIFPHFKPGAFFKVN